jgi:hypothetical protein
MLKMFKFSPQIRVQDTRGGGVHMSSGPKFGGPGDTKTLHRHHSNPLTPAKFGKGVFLISREGSLGEQ